MSEHYDFHYQPTGSGAISGQQVLEQTEDAINELGDYVNDNVGGAMDVAQQALETAQNAEQDAQTALDTANSFSDAIQSAQQDASTALSTAQTAQTTATNANNTAIQAQQDANTAVTTANNASGQVSTLSGTVTALGQRVTTAEGNIGQNTSDITALTTRVGTAEGNITTLQNDVTIAQGNASSAMATAGQVKQQAYVFRYSSTALVASSTNSNTLLDNTDNLKVGDKVIDSSGVLFSVTAIDTANSTFTIGTALIDLAQDSDVVHKSGNETVGGNKTFTNDVTVNNSNATVQADVPNLIFQNPLMERASTTLDGEQTILFTDKNNNNIASIQAKTYTSGTSDIILTSYSEYNGVKTTGIMIRRTPTTSKFQAYSDNVTSLGDTNRRWANVYATNYYYGSNNVEFSTKFVTTDTNQTISGEKTFSNDITLQGTTTPVIKTISNIVQDTSAYNGSVSWVIRDKDNLNNILESSLYKYSSKGIDWQLRLTGINNGVSNTKGIRFTLDPVNNVANFVPIGTNSTSLGNSSAKWKDVNTYLVNGLEPSSLSLPSGNVSDFIDISSYFSNTGTGDTNTYTAPGNGWIFLRLGDISGCQASIYDANNNMMWGQSLTGSIEQMTIPILKGQKLTTQWATSSSVNVVIARFIPCQGNV